MAQVLITDTKLDNLVQTISNKSGATLPLTIDEMMTVVAAIETGGTAPSGTINITENGTHNVTNYASANVNIQPSLQSKTFTPTAAGATITPDTGNYGLSSVTVNGDTDLAANNIKHGVNIFGTTGTFGVKIESILAAPSERGQTITFTGLKAQPLAFSCTLEDQGTFTSARTVYNVVYDGNKVYNLTSYRSGGSLLIYKYENCTFTYNNGTLTITSPSSGVNGVFQAFDNRLLYIYEE